MIMVDVTSDLKYTIEDKLKYVGEELAKTEGEVPAVTLSVGVAFSDRKIRVRAFSKTQIRPFIM